MKYLVAMDSFKGNFTSYEAGAIITGGAVYGNQLVKQLGKKE